jgi:hypothetical protein
MTESGKLSSRQLSSKKLKRFTLHLSLELYSFYSDIADQENSSLSAVINRVLRDHRRRRDGVVTA